MRVCSCVRVWALEDGKDFQRWDKKENPSFCVDESSQRYGPGAPPVAALDNVNGNGHGLEKRLGLGVRWSSGRTLALPLHSWMALGSFSTPGPQFPHF